MQFFLSRRVALSIAFVGVNLMACCCGGAGPQQARQAPGNPAPGNPKVKQPDSPPPKSPDKFIERFGKPDVDETNENDKPKPDVFTRRLHYKAEKVKVDFTAADKENPPKNWTLHIKLDEKDATENEFLWAMLDRDREEAERKAEQAERQAEARAGSSPEQRAKLASEGSRWAKKEFNKACQFIFLPEGIGYTADMFNKHKIIPPDTDREGRRFFSWNPTLNDGAGVKFLGDSTYEGSGWVYYPNAKNVNGDAEETNWVIVLKFERDDWTLISKKKK